MKREKIRRKFFNKVMVSLCAFLCMLCIGTVKVKAADVTNASTLPLNGEWSSVYQFKQGGEQWYKFIVPETGSISFTIMTYRDISLEGYTSDLSTRIFGWGMSGTELSPKSESVNFVLSKGTYYLKVREGKELKYRMRLSYTNYHTNNSEAISYDSPQNVSLNSTVTAAMTMTDPLDWYRITIPGSGKYNFVFSGEVGIHITLYDEFLTDSQGLCWQMSQAYANHPATANETATLKKGVYYVKVEYNDLCPGYGKYSFTVKSVDSSAADTKVSSISISGNKRVTAGKRFTLKANVAPANASNKKVTWSSSNKKVAAVNSKGVVSTKRAGRVTITARAQDGSGKKKSCTVIVLPKKMSAPKVNSPKKGQMKLRWGKQAGVSGYQVQYAKNSRFKSAKTKLLKNKTADTVIKKLSRKKKYYARVRGYVKVGSKFYYGPWSSAKKIRIK